MRNIPNKQSKMWRQSNKSDLFGNIHITKNISFDKAGYLKLSGSSRAIMNETIDAQWDNPASITYNEDYGYFVATWDRAFSLDASQILTNTPTEIATAGVPTTDIETDSTMFGGFLVVTQDTDVDYYDTAGNSWVDTNISLTAGRNHQAVNFLSLSALAIANINTVLLYASPLTATPTRITTLTIPSDFQITGMRYFNQFLYIATRHAYNGKACLFVWSGSGTSAQQVYEVDSDVIYSVCIHKNSVYMIDGFGQLLRFNGGGFDVVDALPIYYTTQQLSFDRLNLGIYKNIMASNGEVMYILINNDQNDNDLLLSQPSGVWCYDEEVGLYHKYAVSNALVRNETIATASINTTTNQITTTNDYSTGTEVYYQDAGSTTIPELVSDTKYFVIRVDATHIKLAETKALALAGTAIDLTGAGNNSQNFTFFPNIDYGQYFSARTMVVAPITAQADRIYGDDLFWGAEVYRRDSTGDYGYLGCASGGVESRGYFITPKITSDQITSTFNLLTLKFLPLTSELDKIIIKYRTEDDMRTHIDRSTWAITWTSSTTFTTTQAEWANASTGDEVEILTGAGGGLLAHISTITENAGTYTVTLDDSHSDYLSGDIGTAVFRNWIKLDTIQYGDIYDGQHFYSREIGVTGTFLQLKIELRGIGVTIEEMIVDDKYYLPASI